MSLIQPRTLKGFRDFLPELMMPREQLIQTARDVYRSFGFAPIDTPALEYLEILAGKGGEESDRQMYRFVDHGNREVGMRFDLTVPLARYVAQHINQLGTPFKRYHIASVWRGEKNQDGRYREFMQCDFDTIGTRSMVADIETALVIHELLCALQVKAFTIKINNRKILNGLLQKLELSDQSVPVLRALDKLGKISPDDVAEEMMRTASATRTQTDEVLKISRVAGSNQEILRQLEPLMAGSPVGEEGLAELESVVNGIDAAGVVAERFVVNVAIARGLDYYTGTIYETFLDDLPGIGSVCSGGRYDNLAELYTKQELPGIGASLGLDRLLAALEKLGLVDEAKTPAPVLLVYFDAHRLNDYLKIATDLRRAGIGVELFPEAKKIGQQLKYANRKGFRCAIVAGENEFAEGKVQLKDLVSGNSNDVELDDGAQALVEAVQRLLA